ncbi:MAG TPA: GNAT family N-acetyltransferase, partial [Woeseiaceae bacterium]|nr:GNAT family N-acetyltransferase [Woeseiaceae bacterium]
SQPTIEIERRDGEERGCYAALDGPRTVGELHYERRDGRIVATHTEVDAALRGRGIALELVKALVADARAESMSIVPHCSYVRRQLETHPEWQDVLHRAGGETGRAR